MRPAPQWVATLIRWQHADFRGCSRAQRDMGTGLIDDHKEILGLSTCRVGYDWNLQVDSILPGFDGFGSRCDGLKISARFGGSGFSPPNECRLPEQVAFSTNQHQGRGRVIRDFGRF
ncbi:hypothetical protein SBBP1_800026 [Burkholderiales bacterium]|nr:hypothetical protein SBBP1_800026 [Burkholderiales bacterium]